MEEMILEEVQQFVNFLKPMAAGKISYFTAKVI
jgi:hypothetical protein